ncbi:hypothetical protein EIN_226410 [Entamoeba invadens IP1]|uniref:Uncharacterized protein n=1 Tax=Entamoeba invadens IP1 TaxID=370355 RepID=A0A0A1U8F9_ENTIV|nr:hypothetical protein EIN_226410 [Entamoeba invadens IP1]ELP88268.1 hypothetical protein EIN_226410 [Entamoeba invadens IP1]|eukprot:XP_004255039.1 hypothetical protein EIN_226410 [Entamoeba invadens IP1]
MLGIRKTISPMDIKTEHACCCGNVRFILTEEPARSEPPKEIEVEESSAHGIVRVKYREFVLVEEGGRNHAVYKCLLCNKVVGVCFSNNDVFIPKFTCQADLQYNETYQIALPNIPITDFAKHKIDRNMKLELLDVKRKKTDQLYKEKEERIREFVKEEERKFEEAQKSVENDFNWICSQVLHTEEEMKSAHIPRLEKCSRLIHSEELTETNQLFYEF